ncbi:MAG: formylglycine-generating enzyme family protein [Bacteroidales bacterium]|nr:formylglycine-generating enzyme family protein [Bacteroidales bacterium]
MKRFFYFTMILLCAVLVGCKPDTEAPTVFTQEVSDIAINTASVVYNVESDGGAEVTSRGVCWDTIQNPTIDNDKTNDGTGIGIFTSELSNLVPQKTYYVRAYAVNSVGVSYGEEKSFVTLEEEEEVIQLENKTITVNGVTFTMVAVEGGLFAMGAQNVDPNEPNYDSEAWDREAPVHLVTLSDYYIGETEVTQELWEAVMGTQPSHFIGDKKPVEQVTWYNCQSFVMKLNQLTGMKFRFPTEAEWEFAAKGGNKSEGYYYSGSDDINDVAWYAAEGKKTREVKTKMPNELGIYDMCGNVMEWCYDLFGDYTSDHQVNPTGSTSGTDCMVRGGCCLSDATYCRTTVRSFFHPGGQSYGIGFRLALQAE